MNFLRQKRAIFGFLMILFVLLFFIGSPKVLAQLNELGQAGNQAGLEKTELAVMIGRIINIILGILGIILAVLLIASGIMWMTSAGNEEKIKKAKELISSAAIGLVIVLLAYTLASFIISKFTTVVQ